MSYANEPRPGTKVFAAILLTPLALFALADLLMIYYEGIGLLPSMPDFFRLVIHGFAAFIVLKYVGMTWWYLRTRRIMRFHRDHSMHTTNLVMLKKSATKMPSPLEIMAFLLLMLGAVAAIHIFRHPSAPFYFLLIIPTLVFYPLVEALLLVRWKHKELQNG